jgi:hypothetical protein
MTEQETARVLRDEGHPECAAAITVEVWRVGASSAFTELLLDDTSQRKRTKCLVDEHSER